MDARSVVEAVIACWRTQDVESTLMHSSEDVVYTLHLPERTLPFAGVSQGKDAVRTALHMMLEQFDYLKYDQQIVGVDGDVVRVQTQYKLHHRRTGGNLEGSLRTVFTVRAGMVVRCEEYVDEGLVETFMQLARQREAANEIVEPPRIARTDAAPPRAASTEPCDKESCKS